MFSSNLRSLLTGRDVKGNSPFHIAARMTDGSLGTFLKDFVNLYSDKVYLMNCLCWKPQKHFPQDTKNTPSPIKLPKIMNIIMTL